MAGALKESTAADLMAAFLARTGVTSSAPPQRYLWTDAFAVCNCIGLADALAEPTWLEVAVRLASQVHQVLGRHRPDDPRRGWLSGLSEEEGGRHPTRGGLRIGKPRPERRVDEPFDEHLEWARDGQYFHYLTKWMHALSQLGRATGDARYTRWAIELVETSTEAFTQVSLGGARHLAWKLSVDRSRVLVGTSGQHDALDGFTTCAGLRDAATALREASGGDLASVCPSLAAMASGGDWATSDPLGLGGLLMDAARIAQLEAMAPRARDELLEGVLDAAQLGLEQWARALPSRPFAPRLAFRELGLAIGFRALERVQAPTDTVRRRLEALRRLAPLGAAIESFWLEPGNRSTGLWAEHRDINEVMLATALVPEGFVRVVPAPLARLE